jgi:DNA-binding response OmpR family regulator
VIREGYEATIASKSIDGIRLAKELRPDLILLDIMVPELNGWEVCRRLKQDPETVGIPVVMVTGRVEEGDKVLGLEMGADDYVTKPFSPREFVARIRAVRRRSVSTWAGGDKSHLKAGPLELDRHRFEVTMNGQRVDLTRKEFELLATLVITGAGSGVMVIGAPGRVFRRDELLDLVWRSDAFVEPRTVDVHLARLRAKFLAAGLAAPEIDTVRGIGYRLREPE